MSLVRVFLFLCIAGAFAATAAAADTYPIRDSKFPANELVSQVYWLDDEH